MEVILKTNIKGLGNALDIIQVKDGYARNYLFPRKLATIATKVAKRLIEVDLEKVKSIYLRGQKTAEDIATRLEGIEINIIAKTTDGEKLYGSITGKEISTELNKLDFVIDGKQIEIAEPIRKLGMYTVKIVIPPAVTASIKVWVVDEKAQA